MKVLITGGAGYIGSVLVRQLLNKEYQVRVLDLLNFGGESIVELMNDPNFEFIKGDVRKEEDREKALEGVEAVVNLAAIVGDPACAKQPELAKETNLEATKILYLDANKKGVRKFIFASTCSNYGKMVDPNSYVNEESDLTPVSLYAETKVAAESFLLSQNHSNVCKPTCLRFSTVYGLSPRMRFDLTVNEFTRDVAMDKELIIFGEQFWRPYCHVYDLARSVVLTLQGDKKKTAFEVFNVGDTNENYQKKMLANEIKKQVPGAKISYVKKNEDPRDYRVSFEKIKNNLGFNISKNVPEGIEQIIQVIKDGFLLDPCSSRYKNI